LPGQRVLLFVLYSARVVQSTRESFLAIAKAKSSERRVYLCAACLCYFDLKKNIYQMAVDLRNKGRED